MRIYGDVAGGSEALEISSLVPTYIGTDAVPILLRIGICTASYLLAVAHTL